MRKVLEAVIVEWKAMNLVRLMCEPGIDWQRLGKTIWEPHDMWHWLIIETTKLRSGFYCLENKRSIPWTEARVIIRVSEYGTNVLMYHTVFLKNHLIFTKFSVRQISVSLIFCNRLWLFILPCSPFYKTFPFVFGGEFRKDPAHYCLHKFLLTFSKPTDRNAVLTQLLLKCVKCARCWKAPRLRFRRCMTSGGAGEHPSLIALFSHLLDMDLLL
jgi:hypothetical protein